MSGRRKQGSVLIVVLIVGALLGVQILFLGRMIILMRRTSEARFQMYRALDVALSGKAYVRALWRDLPEFVLVPNKVGIYRSLLGMRQVGVPLDGALYLFKHTSGEFVDVYSVGVLSDGRGKAIVRFSYKLVSGDLVFLGMEKI